MRVSGDSPNQVTQQAAARQQGRFEKVLFWIFVVGLAWSPFWLGSHNLSAWGINAVLFPGLAILYELRLLVRGERHAVGIQSILFSSGLFIIVLLWIVLQNATWTPVYSHHPIWTMTQQALNQPMGASITVNRDLTTQALVRLVTAASVFWVALQLGRNSSHASLLIQAIACICVAYAICGLIQFAVFPGHTLWYSNPYSKGFLTSTFFNRNSFATFAGIGLIAICGLTLRLYRREVLSRGGTWRLRISYFIETTGHRGAILMGAAFLVLAALVLTGSRGGIIATGFGLLVLGLLALGGRRRSSDKEQRATIAIGAFLVSATFIAFGDDVVGRISDRGLYDENRVAIAVITVGSIFASPVFGYGYGTFSDVFPMFRDRSVNVQHTWEMAHNTYVEVFQGLGLFFGMMLVLSVVLLAWKCLKGATTRVENVTIPSVATSVAFLVGVHALVDFSLQIQSVALTFMAILGVGVAQSTSSRLSTSD